MPTRTAPPAQPEGTDLRDAAEGDPDRAWSPRPWLAAAVALGVAALVVALVLAGGAPQPAVPGLPDAGRLTGWGLPLVTLLSEVAAVGTVGVLLTGAALVPAAGGALTAPGLRAVRAARWWAATWCGSTLVALLLSVSESLGVPVGSGLTGEAVRGQVGTGRGLALLAVAGLAAAVAVVAARARRARSGRLLLLVAVLALLPPTVTGHSASAGEHDLAVTSLAVHVVASALWVGGLLGLLVHLRAAPAGVLAAAVPRFSVLALAAFVVVAASGVLASTARIGTSWEAWASPYGAVLAAKTVGLAALGAAGWRHRRHAIPGLVAGRPRAFLTLAAVEIGLMTAVLGLAVALSRTPMAVPTGLVAAPAHGAGHETLATDIPPVTLGRLLTEWRPDALVLTAVGLALSAYVAGVRALAARGETWPHRRTASAVAGLLLALFALDGGLSTYAPAMVSAQLGQFVVMALVVPALLVLSAPVALWSRVTGRPVATGGGDEPSTGEPTQRALVALSDPFRGLIVFAVLLFALYRTPLIELSLRSFPVHLLVNTAALAAGLALLWPTVAADPVPRLRAPAERVLALAAAVGLLLLLASQLRYGDQLLAGRWFLELGWAWVDPVADQRFGAVVVASAALASLPLLVLAGTPAHPEEAAAPTAAGRPARSPSRTARAGSPPPAPSRARSRSRGSRRRP